MEFLVDGHNLIGSGQLPGISLADEDDERKLVHLLRRYRSHGRKKITVFFDAGLPGGLSRELSGGGVKVIFASAERRSADELIAARLRQAARPRELTVVTSDHSLAALAQARGAQVMSAAEFAARLTAPLPSSVRLREEPLLSPQEVEEWLAFFEETE
ncbi:MAG: NYN domain-containing protein [Anaerolineae bacterium]|nr:NYN domain-containing protein [Anaerolineae bacterium]